MKVDPLTYKKQCVCIVSAQPLSSNYVGEGGKGLATWLSLARIVECKKCNLLWRAVCVTLTFTLGSHDVFGIDVYTFRVDVLKMHIDVHSSCRRSRDMELRSHADQFLSCIFQHTLVRARLSRVARPIPPSLA